MAFLNSVAAEEILAAKNTTTTRTGFEPMTSAIPVSALPIELTSQLGAGQ